MDEEKEKSRIYQIEIIAAFALLVFSAILLFPGKGITGFVSAETKTQQINLTIANSQSYILTTKDDNNFYLTSLMVSGSIIGNGSASIYIDNGKGERRLIYSNIIEGELGLGGITGMGKITGNVVKSDKGEIKKEESNFLVIEYLENIEGVKEDSKGRVYSGDFKYKCIDSCSIEMLLNKDLSYQLLFYVDDGIILNIDEITYNIREVKNG